MGNSRSNMNNGSILSQSGNDNLVGSTDEVPDEVVTERMRAEFKMRQEKRGTQHSKRRRSVVSSHVMAVRRQSSMVHENMVKINIIRNVRDVYNGLDLSDNQLGEGTWGTVKLVTRRDDPSKKAAVKMLQLNEDIDHARLNELRTEINLLQKIDHPHIAKLYETYEDDGLNLYLVMEYLSGGELFDRVIELGYFQESRAAEAVKQMVGAVQYLHSRGIVHRDLKLENFMYRSKGSDNLVLIDFGLSTRFLAPTQHEDGSSMDQKSLRKQDFMKEMVGSSYYMAPEVMKRKYGRECDMWSVGVIAYMLLSGHPPFAGDTDAQIMRKVRRGVFNFNHSAFDKVTENAKDFVVKLLKYDPKERMSAKEALLHPWLSDHHRKMIDRRSRRRGSVMVVEKDIVNNLKNFVHTNRFKKLALQAVAYSTSYEDIEQLQQIFEDIDQDQDGYISMLELQNALRDNPYVDSKQIVSIFEAMDVDGMQKVHLNEFIAASLNHSIMKDETIVSEAFNRLDVNETGEIDEDALRDILGKNFNKAEVEKMLAEFGAEEGKTSKKILGVNKADFVKAMRRVRLNATESFLVVPKDEKDDHTEGSDSSELDL